MEICFSWGISLLPDRNCKTCDAVSENVLFVPWYMDKEMSQKNVQGPSPGWTDGMYTWTVQGWDYTDGFEIGGSFYINGFSSSNEADKLEIYVVDSQGETIFGARLMANEQNEQWKAFIGPSPGQEHVGTQADLWQVGENPFTLSYDGQQFIELFVNGQKHLEYDVGDVTGGELLSISIFERTEGLEVSYKDVFIDSNSIGCFINP